MGPVHVKRSPVQLIYGDSFLFFNNQSGHEFIVHLVGDDIIIDFLQFCPQKPIALIGNSCKPNKLYYYSFTRNHIEGRIKKGNIIENVTGEGWFDHQWGRDYNITFKKDWDWFGIQLDDGRELLLNQFNSIKRKQTFNPMANLIEPNGKVKFTRNVQYYPLKYWKSPFSKAVYPLEWKIVIPAFGMQMNVSPNFYMQEMPIIGPLQAIWEGACLILGIEKTLDGQKKLISGKEFMELVGYANDI
ncbi:MAG: hypothetical protein PWP31_1218 [Clostridia bacterium]|nr:hypothetical protein [Clostridia bacterium]